MANEEHVALLSQGARQWNLWRADNPEVNPDFREADLSGAGLNSADLTEADLGGADLYRADLSVANLSGADLHDANLAAADLAWAELRGADLTGANLTGANLLLAELADANFSGVTLIHTSFSDVDLSEVKGLESVTHLGPSSIGVDTLSRTLRGSGGKFRPEQLEFFEGAGVPFTLLDYLPSIVQSDPLQFYSCFISYSTTDEEFADQLNTDLSKEGIKTWKWNLDAVAGRDLRDNIDRAITSYDKMILVCSINSLTSGPVDREIEKALQKEDQLNAAKAARTKEAFDAGEEPPYVDTNVLVPIRVDDFVFQWDSPLASQVKRLYIPDFTHASPGDEKYQSELLKLRDALNPGAWPPKGITVPQKLV